MELSDRTDVDLSALMAILKILNDVKIGNSFFSGKCVGMMKRIVDSIYETSQMRY